MEWRGQGQERGAREPDRRQTGLQKTEAFRAGKAAGRTACDFLSLVHGLEKQKIKKIENPEVTYSIFARDGTSRIVLKRETREAAEKKARELTDLGWFEVRIEEAMQIEEPDPGK